MTEDRNPESRMDLALSLISRRRSDPTAFRPAGGGMNPLQALEWLGREGIREPLSTAVSYASLSEADARANREGAPWWSRALSGLKEPVDWFNTDRWREASGIAQNRSLGQSVMLAPLTSNIRDPAEVAAAQESRWYRKGSGAVDAAARVTVDPLAVLGGQTIRTMIANTARRGGPAAAAGIRSAAAGNRLGLRDPGRWLGRVDPPDAPPGSFGVPGRTSTTPQFNTPRYLDEIRAARPSTQPLRHRVPDPRAPTSSLDLPPGVETPMVTVLRPVQGGVFKGTGAEGKTLTEIGEMVGRSVLPPGQAHSRNYVPVIAANMISPDEIDRIWPTVARMYADEAVDNILTVRDDMDTMRLRALFYDDPSMAGNQTAHSAIVDFVDRASQRSGTGDMGLPGWISIPAKESRLLEIRDLVIADLRAVTRKFVDDVGMPERVSVGRWQAPGSPIGASGSTFPMDPQWGSRVTTGYRPLTDLEAPMSQRYGTSGPGGMGGASGHRWIEAVVDPRKDIDFFMLSRTGANYAEHEILMSPQTWAEKAVSGLGEHPTSWSSSQARQLTSLAPSSMPGLTSSQIEFGPNAPKWLQRALDELEAAGVESDLLNRYLTAPAGRTREALANRVRAELSVGRRNVLEAEGWTNLPTPGAIRATTLDAGEIHSQMRVGQHVSAVEQIASGKYDAADWFRFGSDQTLPTPPNWHEFTNEVSQRVGEVGHGPVAVSSFVDWLVSRSTMTLKGEQMYPGIQDGIVGWTVKEGAPAGKATMELLPGWQDELKKLVHVWMGL